MTKEDLQKENDRLRNENAARDIAIAALMGYMPGIMAKRLQNPEVIRVGDFTFDGQKTTARLITPWRADGGTVLLSNRIGAGNGWPAYTRYDVFTLDRIYDELRGQSRTEYTSRLLDLVGKAVTLRNRIVQDLDSQRRAE